MAERPAEPGEVCTCGAPAAVVYLDGPFGPTGYCGRQVPDGPCPWCGGWHVTRCERYRLRPHDPGPDR